MTQAKFGPHDSIFTVPWLCWGPKSWGWSSLHKREPTAETHEHGDPETENVRPTVDISVRVDMFWTHERRCVKWHLLTIHTRELTSKISQFTCWVSCRPIRGIWPCDIRLFNSYCSVKVNDDVLQWIFFFRWQWFYTNLVRFNVAVCKLHLMHLQASYLPCWLHA